MHSAKYLPVEPDAVLNVVFRWKGKVHESQVVVKSAPDSQAKTSRLALFKAAAPVIRAAKVVEPRIALELYLLHERGSWRAICTN